MSPWSWRTIGWWSVAVLTAGPAAGQSAPGGAARLSGVVVSTAGGPVPDVEVLIPGTAVRTTTAVDGRFALDRVPAGPQVVIFRKIGFRPEALSVPVDSAVRVLGRILLDPGPYLLPEIHVTAKFAKPERYAATTKYDDFYRRRKVGGGIFLDREALEQRFVGNTFEVFQGLPGVHVDVRPAGVGAKLWFSRCNESPPAIAVWVDGVRLLPPWGISAGYGIDARQGVTPNGAGANSDAGVGRTAGTDLKTRFVDEMVNSVSPADIEAIEVYRGPAGLPGEFNAGDNCGAIVIWTKEGGLRRDGAAGEDRSAGYRR